MTGRHSALQVALNCFLLVGCESKPRPPVGTQADERCAQERGCRLACSEGSVQGHAEARGGGRAQACLTREGRRLHGPFAEWYPNGKLARRGGYKEGRQHGRWVVWFDNGQRRREGSFRDGAPDGRWTYWTSSGAKAEEATFVGGKKNGPATIWDSNGRARRVNYKDNRFAP